MLDELITQIQRFYPQIISRVTSITCVRRRRSALRLTTQGVDAMTATSVLDRERLGQVLSKLSERDRKGAVRGLELLAGACR